MSIVPQVATASTKVSYGTLYGFAVPRTAKNPNQAFMVADIMSSPASSEHIAQSFLRAPVDRTILAKVPTDPLTKVIYQSAIIARTWYQPDSMSAQQIITTLINDVNAGRAQVFSLINIAQDALQDLMNKYAPPIRTSEEAASL
jgi:spermidine/putrescine-binding protein